jgi:hypothetical protein
MCRSHSSQKDVQDLAVAVVQRLDERRHEPDRLGLPHEREVEHDAGRPLVDEEPRHELARADVERHVRVLAAHDDDREAWRDCPSADERRPHHAPVGSIATIGIFALSISSARTDAVCVFPEPFIASSDSVLVAVSSGSARSDATRSFVMRDAPRELPHVGTRREVLTPRPASTSR